MAKVSGPLLSREAHGTLAKKLTYTNTRGQAFARQRNVPTGAPSVAQLTQRDKYAEAVAGWHALSPTQKLEWNATGALAGLSGFSAWLRHALTTQPDPNLYIIDTELGAYSRYINLGHPTELNDLPAITSLVYCRPTALSASGYAYFWGKTPLNSATGQRHFIDQYQTLYRSFFGANSATNGVPSRGATAGSTLLNSWAHHAATWTRSHLYTSIRLYAGTGVPITETGYSQSVSGLAPIPSDATLDFYLMNRRGNQREFIGDMAYLAIWNRALSEAELRQAQSGGPLSVPDGLTLLWANGQDMGPHAIVPTSRSTRVTGALPPNLLLGPPLP